MGAIQQQHDDMDDIKQRLDGWGAMLRGVRMDKLGLSRGRSKTDYIYDIEDAEEIEVILSELKQDKHKSNTGFRCRCLYCVAEQEYYFNKSTQRDAAEWLGIKHGLYKKMLSQLHGHVHGCLKMLKKFKNVA